MLPTLLVLSRQHFDSNHNTSLLCVLSLYILYYWITITGYSKHELSTINMLYSLKTIFHMIPLPPHNGYLFTTATFFCPQGGRCFKRGSTVLNWKHLIFFFKRKKTAKKAHPPPFCNNVLCRVPDLAHRSRFQAFAKKYSFLSPRKVRSKAEHGYEVCKVILETVMRKVDRSKGDAMMGSWILGKTCVFYR